MRSGFARRDAMAPTRSRSRTATSWRLSRRSWRRRPQARLRRTSRADDLVPFECEHPDPLTDVDVRALREACHLEEIAQLRVRQLHQQVGEKLSPGFADHRIAK